MTYGATHGTDPDTFSHSKYILLWGCNVLSTNVHLWSFIQEARKNVDQSWYLSIPVRTRTAKSIRLAFANSPWYRWCFGTRDDARYHQRKF